jgi:hypothetical protein
MYNIALTQVKKKIAIWMVKPNPAHTMLAG